jgi:DNA-binding response OmpR family regulator
MSKRILVIDDDLMVRRTMEQVLTQAGYDVLCAVDGEQGFRLFQEIEPDLVITDIIMPCREGIETIRAIKQANPRTKIIAMSGGARINNHDFLQIACKLGADFILAKPFNVDELCSLVRQGLVASDD